MWLFTNISDAIPFNSPEYIKRGDICFFSDQNIFSSGNEHLLVDGSVVFKGQKLNSKIVEEQLFPRLSQDDEAFLKNCKGNYNLIYISDGGIQVYSDPLGIKKYYFWQKDGKYLVSSELKAIAQNIPLEVCLESIGIYALTLHFTAGRTLFKNVFHNLPGQKLIAENGRLTRQQYWKPEKLLQIKKENISIQNIADILTENVEGYINALNTDRISLSLTGGADTRNLLAVFLKLGVKPHLYTYGNPLSADAQAAGAIARGLGLDHVVHDIKLTADSFEHYARKIISSTGGLASIHRAHRLMAIEKEKGFADTMFLGTMGGEFVRGASEDNYIISSMIYNNWNIPQLESEHIVNDLEAKHVKHAGLDIDSITTALNQEPYFEGNVNYRKHAALSYITAHLHDAQDINLYNTVMDEVYTPFLDVNYLETLFSSYYSFEIKHEIKNKYLRRIENPVYAASFLKATYPPLLKFAYGGSHRPDEVLFNKYYAALAKTIRKKTRPKYQPTFPLVKWMEEFASKNLPACKDFKVIAETFNIDALINELNKGDHKTTEPYWLKFTTPIMMRFILEEYT